MWPNQGKVGKSLDMMRQIRIETVGLDISVYSKIRLENAYQTNTTIVYINQNWQSRQLLLNVIAHVRQYRAEDSFNQVNILQCGKSSIMLKSETQIWLSEGIILLQRRISGLVSAKTHSPPRGSAAVHHPGVPVHSAARVGAIEP